MQKWFRHRYARLMRLDKPIGIWLLMWPCFWSIALASATLPLRTLFLFFLGSVFMRSAGCIVNDLTDRDIDAKVERTRLRPLACGEVTPKEAYLLLAILLLLSFLVALALGWKIVVLGALWLPLVVAYPWMKRITYWPQAFLGLTFNAGALFGWLAVTGKIELPALLLYAGAIFWTLAYDTIYAHQDMEDDAKVGIGSTALALGEYTKPAVNVFYVLFFGFLVLTGYVADASPSYYFIAGTTILALVFALQKTDLASPSQCLLTFKWHNWAGLAIFLACLSAA